MWIEEWMKKNMRHGDDKYRYGGSSSSSSCSSSPTAQGQLGSSEQQQLQLGSFPVSYSSSYCSSSAGMEKEHMFDKVVTPSDVGKLNRLVIPKQHAEKYFPLDSSTNDKGLLLNFEDRSGKPWRFRYSYWNSSQSYVMTKGWSRFVKEKKLDAGDIVSFQRGMGDAAKDRLFIDWRRRPEAPSPAFHHYQYPPTWSHPPPYYLPHFHPPPPFHRPLQPHLTSRLSVRPAPEEVVFESVPVAQGKAAAAAKRLRLFGVNITPDTSSAAPPAPTAPPPHNVGLFLGNPNPCSSSSMSFDLDI